MQTINDLGTYTFQAVLANTVAKFADRPALSFASGEPITYREVASRIDETKELLFRLGVAKGDRVAIYGASSPNWGISYFAIVTLGAIAVPLLPDFSAKEVETCLRHSGATVLFVNEKLLSRVGDPSALGIGTVLRLDDLTLVTGKETRSGRAPAVEISEDDTASIIYTSGTTGRSKGVELSHKNLVFTAIGGQSFQDMTDTDVGLSILPMSHVYEFTIGFLMFFMNGSCIYYLEKPPTVTTLMPALLKVRPTIMLSVPIIMEKIYKGKIVPTFTSKKIVAFLYKLPPFRKLFHRIAGKSLMKTFGGRIIFFGIGGSKVDPTVERFMKEAKFPYAIGYGLTETSPLIAGAGPKVTKPGTVGPIMPGIEVKLVDVNPETGVGEVAVRGPNVMKGYYKDPEMTASIMTADGFLRTGDLGTISADKKCELRLELRGRSKNMILGASGENIYPEDIEFVLNQHPLVTESLVVEGENSTLVAIVQLTEPVMKSISEAMTGMSDAMSGMSHAIGHKKDEVIAEIRSFVNQNVNRISRIDRVEIIEQFEKTASSKIKRYLYSIRKSMGSGSKQK
jgi:long-chain acyl-CoA synthetase